MNEKEFRKVLKSGISGGYLFFGEEDYLKNHCVSEVREKIVGNSPFSNFNHIIITEKNYSAASISEAFRTMPMMAEQKLVELCDIDMCAFSAKEVDALVECLSVLKDSTDTVFLLHTDALRFDSSTLKRPSSMLKKLSGVLCPVEFPAPTEDELMKWIRRHFAADKIEILPPDAQYLVVRCGRNMFTLINEIEKLCAAAHIKGSAKITKEDIDEYTCDAVELGQYELANAISEGRASAALDALRKMQLRKIEPALALGMISKTYSQILMAKTGADEGVPTSELAAKLKVTEGKLFHLLSDARRMDREKLAAILTLLAKADREVKLSYKSYLPLEEFVCLAAKL